MTPHVKVFDSGTPAVGDGQLQGLLAGLGTALASLTGPISLTLHAEGLHVAISTGGSTSPAGSAAADPEAPERQKVPKVTCSRTPMEAKILEVLATAGKPLKQRAIAMRMKQPMTPHFKSCCSRLRKQGMLLYLNRRGFWLTGKAIPEEEERRS